MLLTKKKQFEDAILQGKEIKTKTVFYTDEFENITYKIGDYVKEFGIYVGNINEKNIFVGLKESSKKLTWGRAKMWCNQQGKKLPDILELMLINQNKDLINQSLCKNGGEEIKDEWYWSSTEYSSTGARGLSMSSGFALNYYKEASRNVRCVVAV